MNHEPETSQANRPMFAKDWIVCILATLVAMTFMECAAYGGDDSIGLLAVSLSGGIAIVLAGTYTGLRLFWMTRKWMVLLYVAVVDLECVRCTLHAYMNIR